MFVIPSAAGSRSVMRSVLRGVGLVLLLLGVLVLTAGPASAAPPASKPAAQTKPAIASPSPAQTGPALSTQPASPSRAASPAQPAAPVKPAAASSASPAQKKPVTITSESMEADNQAHRAIFIGKVVAESDGSIIYSDKMDVLYDGPTGRIVKIDCFGSVKVVRGQRVILSDEATYYGDEDKIAFRGNPRIMEGQNLVTGSVIVYYPNADRLIVEKSRVYMQSQ